MKKSIITTAMALGMALLCCSCGGSGTAEQSPQTDNTVQSAENVQTQDNAVPSFISEAEAANRLDALVEKYGKTAVKTNYLFKDGTTSSEYYYKDAERYVYELGDYVYIDEDGEIYGFDDNVSLPFRTIFVGDGCYEEYRSAAELAEVFQYGETEEITSQKTENGVTVIESTYPKEADTAFYASLGYTDDEVDSYKYVYEFDESTKELKSLRSYIVKDGQDSLIIDMVIVPDCEEYVPDEQLRAEIFGDDSRTLTVIAAPGTDDEKTFTQTVKKGSAIQVVASLIYEQKLYTDKECTVELSDDGLDRMADQTVYMKKAE